MELHIALLALLVLTAGSPADADLPGPPPGVPSGPTSFLPGENVDDAAGAPSTPGPLVPIGDTTKPGVANVAFYDFGTISNASAQPIRHEFVLRNVTHAPVVIEHLEPGCACVHADLPGSWSGQAVTIAPGAGVTVGIAIDPKELYVGTINKIVWVYLVGEKSPAFTMHVIGHVTPMATFAPNTLDFGPVRAGSGVSRQLTVVSDCAVYGAHPPDPVCMDGNLKIVRSSLPEHSEGERIIRTYRVSVSSRAPRGILSETIAMPPADGTGQGAAILVTGRVDGKVAASVTLVPKQPALETAALEHLPQAASFSLTDAVGRVRSLINYRGRPVTLFFFCGCPACRRCAELWGQRQRNGDRTTSLIVFAGDDASARDFAAQTGLDPKNTVLLPDRAMRVTTLYRADPCPRVFVLDAQGRVRYTNNHADDAPQTASETVIVARAIDALHPSP